MNNKIAALIGAAGAILTANGASAAEIVNDQGRYSGLRVNSYAPIGQSFVAADPWLSSIAFFYVLSGAPADRTPIRMTLYDGSGTSGRIVASRTFTPTTNEFNATDFTGTSLTVGSTYTAALMTDAWPYQVYLTENRYAGGQIYTPVSLAPMLGKDNSFYDLMFRIEGTAVGPVPEPATWAMMLVGFGLVGAAMRRRRKVRVIYA